MCMKRYIKPELNVWEVTVAKMIALSMLETEADPSSEVLSAQEQEWQIWQW